ncbi:MAG: 4Fe-4S binding protein, partial [Candidatus Aureabacteria bacterium]|nr:4Fe-4S binding protein [Candidatus Auribacterota bacterium]
MKKKLVIARRISQGFFFFLFIYILWSTTYPLKGLLPAETFFNADPLIIFMTSISERIILPGIFLSLAMIVLTIVFGRFFCGWICPLGTSIDAVGAIRKRGKVLKDRENKRLRSIKFIIFAIIFLFAFAGVQVSWVFDPIVIMARFVSLNLIPTVTLAIDKSFSSLIRSFDFYGPLYDFYRSLKTSFLGVKVFYFSHALNIFIFFLAILATSLFVKRSWCRALCPLGALYAF